MLLLRLLILSYGFHFLHFRQKRRTIVFILKCRRGWSRRGKAQIVFYEAPNTKSIVLLYFPLYWIFRMVIGILSFTGLILSSKTLYKSFHFGSSSSNFCHFFLDFPIIFLKSGFPILKFRGSLIWRVKLSASMRANFSANLGACLGGVLSFNLRAIFLLHRICILYIIRKETVLQSKTLNFADLSLACEN